MWFFREVFEIGEGVEERVFEIFDDVGDYGFGLGVFEVVEGRDWEFGGDGWIWIWVLEIWWGGGEEEEWGEEDDGENKKSDD